MPCLSRKASMCLKCSVSALCVTMQDEHVKDTLQSAQRMPCAVLSTHIHRLTPGSGQFVHMSKSQKELMPKAPTLNDLPCQTPSTMPVQTMSEGLPDDEPEDASKPHTTIDFLEPPSSGRRAPDPPPRSLSPASLRSASPHYAPPSRGVNPYDPKKDLPKHIDSMFYT
jgi:hypothetical protein